MWLVLKLADLPQHAVGELHRSRRGGVRVVILREAAADPDLFADVFEEDPAIGAVSAQRDRRIRLERPVLHLAARVLHVHEKVRMWILPVDLRERAGELTTVPAVPLGGERVMRERRRG